MNEEAELARIRAEFEANKETYDWLELVNEEATRLGDNLAKLKVDSDTYKTIFDSYRRLILLLGTCPLLEKAIMQMREAIDKVEELQHNHNF